MGGFVAVQDVNIEDLAKSETLFSQVWHLSRSGKQIQSLFHTYLLLVWTAGVFALLQIVQNG
jgi:hypothetical protein